MAVRYPLEFVSIQGSRPELHARRAALLEQKAGKMSQQQLEKLEAEVSRLERDLRLYKDAQTKSAASEAIIKYINDNRQNDPFSSDYPHPNPFHTMPGPKSCCSIS